MFKLSTVPLELLDLRKGLSSPSVGAFNCFEGWVRNRNEGKVVCELNYEVHETLCYKEAQKIIQETHDRFNVIAVKCYHRVGRLKVGDMAVWIGVTAMHRDDSFKACRYLIDEMKNRLPIWKKEYYGDGNSDWLSFQTHMASS